MAVLAIGGVALFNKAGVVPANSASASAPKVADASLAAQPQLQQLQSQIAQYQAREQQYQSREQQYQQALDQARSQVAAAQQQSQQMQLLLMALQQRGLITVTADGRIFVDR